MKLDELLALYHQPLARARGKTSRRASIFQIDIRTGSGPED
jgi:hypothetical protein